jgi:hypothetical protein
MSDRPRYGAPARPADTRAVIDQVGKELFGERWKTPLAEALGVSHGYISQIMGGGKPVTQDFIDRLRTYVAEQAAEEEARHQIRMIVLRRFEVQPPKPAPAVEKKN